MSSDPLWHVRETEFDPARLASSETIFTIGNGYLGTRGAFEETYPGETRATFVHGVFDDAPVFFTELVNAPDWLELSVYVDGEEFGMQRGQVLSYLRELDLRTGLLTRTVHWRSPQGCTVELKFERFASLADPHLLCLRVTVTALDAAAPIEVRAGIDGCPDNLGLAHWETLDQEAGEHWAWLMSRTRTSGIRLAMGMRLHVEGAVEAHQSGCSARRHPTLSARWTARSGQPVTVEKDVYVYTSREEADPAAAVRRRLEESSAPVWTSAWNSHASRWEQEWRVSDVVVEGDDEAQLALRFSIYHLLIAAPRHDERVSIGARTLSGYGYRGHVFWDTDTFILPFFTYTQPAIARNLVSYRWHTLDGARRKARRNGYAGAQYAWESADTGDEVTPTWVIHPSEPTELVRIWTGDIEIHITADVAYGVWQYWRLSGDDEFMQERGADILIETARFWASRAEWDAKHNRYQFRDVIGPDEYHDHVHNSAFTNYMARWNLRTAAELVAQHPEVSAAAARRLGLSANERKRWEEVSAKLYCPYDATTGLIEQFEGYFNLKDVPLADLEPRTQSAQSLLGIEGVAQTQIIKQPDVLMMMHLLPEQFSERDLRANYDYYTPRTDLTYGSSLGPAIQTIIACEVGDMEGAYENFMRAARADLKDVRGNAGDGIHGASAGGLWQAAVFGFAGLRLTPTGWVLRPRLPGHWRRLRFNFVYRGQPVSVDLPAQVEVDSEVST